MSFGAVMVRLFMRMTIKRQIHKDQALDPVELRAMVDKQAGRMKWPDFIDVEEVSANGVRALWVTPPDAHPDKVFYYLHGGGYVFCAPDTTHKDLIWRLAVACKCKVLAIDYRLAPENPFPAAIEDSVAGYRYLLDQGYDAGAIGIGGDSAGGGLTFGSLFQFKEEGLPLPACAVGLSPWTDLLATGETVQTNLKSDLLIPGDKIAELAQMYYADSDPRIPQASPLYGDYTGMPPTLIQVSDVEVLLDDSRRLAAKIDAAGVPVALDVWHNLPHVWQAISRFLPEGRAAIKDIGMFVRGHLRAKPRAIEDQNAAAKLLPQAAE
jgi:monoterpene epsilon-lactone hydrolase|nr:esterase B [uncultured bacterium]